MTLETTLSVPGKTFLLGEYVALDGGPSILLSTDPRFELRATTGAALESDALPHPFAPASPAGRYYAQHEADFKNAKIEFIDHHHGQGGLGASSAQFALMLAFHRGLSPNAADYPWEEILKEYRACAWNGEGTPPSGADIVSQLNGGVTCFDGRSLEVESLVWSFETLGFTLFRTGEKLATHEHLKKTGVAPHASLRTIVEEGRKAFKTSDEMRLIEAVSAAAHVLRESGLTSARALSLLAEMKKSSDLFYAAKGCGAMGADIIVALHEKSQTERVKTWADQHELVVCGGLSDLSKGLS